MELGHPHGASSPWDREAGQVGSKAGVHVPEQGGLSREEGKGNVRVGELLAILPADGLIGTEGARAVHVEEEEQLSAEEGLVGVDGGELPLAEEEARGVGLAELCRLDADAEEDPA